jgi:hypothetical protein
MVAGVDSDKNGWSCCFRGQDSAIDVATPNPEFDAWRWEQPPELSTLAVSFKRRLYLSFLQSFPRYSETRGLERYPERSPAIATHRHGRSFIQNWAHLEI